MQHCTHFMSTARGPTKMPCDIIARIEATGRRVSFSPDFLKLIPQSYAADGESLVLTTPRMLGFVAGSGLRKVHNHAINRHGLRFVPPISAMVAAELHANQPVDQDIVVGMDFIHGLDGKEYVFYISHDMKSVDGILDGALQGKWLGAIYFPEPWQYCPQADFVSADQLLLYLAQK